MWFQLFGVTLNLQCVVIFNFLWGIHCKTEITKPLVYFISFYGENYVLITGYTNLGTMHISRHDSQVSPL